MTREQALDWALKNLPEWPQHIVLSSVELVRGLDHWVLYKPLKYSFRTTGGLLLLNTVTGEYIDEEEFLEARKSQRLQPCGMSYKELIDDLFL